LAFESNSLQSKQELGKIPGDLQASLWPSRLQILHNRFITFDSKPQKPALDGSGTRLSLIGEFTTVPPPTSQRLACRNHSANERGSPYLFVERREHRRCAVAAQIDLYLARRSLSKNTRIGPASFSV